MLTAIASWLRRHKPDEPLPELDDKLAVGALMVRLAKADAHYAFEEIARIDTILAAHEGLNPIEAAKRRALCERIEAAAPDTEGFAALVRETVAYPARVGLFEALWQVSLADRALRQEEEAFLATVAGTLGITPEDATATAARHGH